MVPTWLVVRHFGNDDIASAGQAGDVFAVERPSNSENAFADQAIETSIVKKF